MGNCLVTKLKSVVNNEHLCTLEEFLLQHEQVNVPGELYYENFGLNGTYLDVPAKIRLLDGKVFDSTTQRFEGQSEATFDYSGADHVLTSSVNLPSAGDYSFIVENKYKLTGIHLPVNVIADCNALKVLNLFNIEFYSRHHYGSILDFGGMTNLVNFYFAYNHTIDGELSTLFAAMAANGKTTTLTVIPNNIVTYNGSTIPSNKKLVVTFENSTYSVEIQDV